MIQSAVYSSYLVLNSSDFCRPSHEVFVKLSKPHYFHFFLHGAGHEIQISYSCQRCILNMCILSYIYGSYFLELGEDIELFCVVQDFCLVTVPHVCSYKMNLSSCLRFCLCVFGLHLHVPWSKFTWSPFHHEFLSQSGRKSWARTSPCLSCHN